MKILITGGAGFIGSHLAESYLHRGDDVYIIDDLSTGSLNNIIHLQDNHIYKDRFFVTTDTILNNKIIHICLTSLVQNITRPATIESLLIFIKTLGKDFFVREARHGNNTEKYFIKIEESLDNEKISKRYKFTLRDILDLKKEWEI